MRRIAHLSDVHTLDPRVRRASTRYRLSAGFVSIGRPLDPRARAQKLLRGLRAARSSGADHVVISGDLTEMGAPEEFEHFASVLDEAGMKGDEVTLVPGNHDAYTSPNAWREALAGPLARWASASATEPGKVVERGDVVLLPIDSTFFQNIVRSGGTFSSDAARAVEKRAEDPALKQKALVMVMHHSPIEQHHNPLTHWVIGLRGRNHVLDVLAKYTNIQLLHGHLHRALDRARMFGAPAVVDDEERPRVRLYDVRNGRLESAGMS